VIKKFTKSNAGDLQNRILMALTEIEDEFGVDIAFGNGTFDPDLSLRMKMTCTLRNPDGSSKDARQEEQARDFVMLAPMHDIPADSLGRVFTPISGDSYKITGWRVRATKRPVVAECISGKNNGKSFVFSSEEVVHLLKLVVKA